ncbi:MAG: YihY/virulence factor BrkB family protein [Lachnospiraceae bacterium]|jgi:membrane protein|nr:YihY family inner membrane protein [Lachnospiraceae bacterium A4]MCI8266089.1 YihY/virulence factor BrkB family protein [Lachnospiraceae bacterium]
MRKKRRITRKELKTIYEIGYSFVRKVKFDHVSSFAGHAALFLLMSIFPMAMFCISIFSYLPIDIGRLTQYLLTIIPEGSLPLVNQILAEAYAGSTTIMTSFTMLVMLFCASKGVYAVIIGMNAVYGIRETRGTMLLYALAAAYVVIFFAAIGLMMILIVLGNNIFNWLLQFVPGMIAFDRLFRYGKYLCMLVFLLVFFLLVYMNVPDRRSKIRYEFFGALFSTVAWLAYSWAFSYYISNFANYSVTYGSLATVVIFILWLYGTMNIVFVGAEINVVLRKFAEYGYNYKRAYEYYKDKYHGELLVQKGIVIKLHARRRTAQKKDV